MRKLSLIINIAVLSCLILCLNSCHKSEPCPENNDTYIYLYPSIIKKVAYSGYDTLTFIRFATNDTHTFIGQGKRQYFQGIPKETDGCGGNELYEGFSIKFISQTFSSPIYFDAYHNPTNSEYAQFEFQSQKFIGAFADISSPYYKDSIVLNDTIYRDLTLISDLNGDTSYYVLYNKVYGAIKVKLKTGETWGLIHK